MTSILEELKGKRTYILAVCLAIWGILGLILGKNDIQGVVSILLEAGAIIGLRAGINEESRKLIVETKINN